MESLRVSMTNGRGKAYQKISSDPSIQSKRVAQKTEKEKPKRVLHTIEQPDGSIVGYCTEETGKQSPSNST
jgi:hypothetical protein